MPAVVSGAATFVVTIGVALALLPAARHLFSMRRRAAVVGGSSVGAIFLLFFLVRGVLGINPVRITDQRALAAELKANFRYGISTVYQASELVALQGLYEKYKNSWADLTELNGALVTQTALKTEHETLSREFREKLDAVLVSNAFLPDKRASIVDLKEYYALRNVDVSAAEKALSDIDRMVTTSHQAPTARRSSSGTISITPLRATSPVGKKTSAAPAKKAAARPAPMVKKKAAAPVKAAKKVAAPAKSKKITPNKEIDPKKKKKKSDAFRATID
jgi:hypothetical protein